MRTENRLISAVIFILFVMMISACNFGSSPTAEPTRQMNATQSYETAVARVTQFYLETVQASESVQEDATPTLDPASTGATETPTEIPASATPIPPTARPTSTPEPCDRAAPGDPIDVTIPDDTELVIGQAFDKTWRLVNVGTCTWNNRYAVVWISGEQMGVEDVVFLSGTVGPGQSVDITVPMTAPDEIGNYQSNWKLRNDTGVLFGIGEQADRVFWVRIEAVAPTATPTITPTPTETSVAATATSEPVIHATNSPALVLDDTIDLDALQVNPGGSVDINYALDAGGNHLLTPINGARIGVWGQATPGFNDCKAASLGSAALAAESVSVNTYLCYQTDSGRYGRFQITGFNNSDGTLTLQAVTWSNP